MKIQGKKISRISRRCCVIPREDGDIVLWCRLVESKEYEALYPEPQPMTFTKPGGATEVEVNDPVFLTEHKLWSEDKFKYTLVASLDDPENALEWDAVDLKDRKTWGNVEAELREVFSELEYTNVFMTVLTVCGLNQSKIDEARETFLAQLKALEVQNTSLPEGQ